MAALKTIMVQVTKGTWMEVPKRMGKKERKQKIVRYLEKLNQQAITFNPNKK